MTKVGPAFIIQEKEGEIMKKFFSVLAAGLALLFALAACVPAAQAPGDTSSLGEDYSGVNDKIADFTQGLSKNFYASNWANGGMFDCVWRSENVRYNAEKKVVELAFSQENGTNYAGEYRSNAFYGYGYFSVCMKAVKKDGVVSSLFTYTGPSDGKPWDEIDIEFLGNDTTQVQFNYYTNGEGHHEYLYKLGYDASEEFHEYGFFWGEGEIVWYVDGKPVYRATENIPVTPARIMINAWPGKKENVGDWSGVFDGVYPIASAEYKWIGYRAADAE